MARTIKSFILCLFALLLFSGQSWADYTASSWEDVHDILDPLVDENDNGSAIINGQTVTWTSETDIIKYYVNGEHVATTDESTLYFDEQWDEEERRVFELIAQALFTSAFASPASPISAAAKTSGIVFDRLVMPGATTRRAKEKAADQKAMHMTRTIGGQLRYANIEQNDSDGDVIGCNIGMAHDFENFTIGGILPYDYMDFDSFFNANRLGLILFAQYFHDLSPSVTATFTGNLNYVYTDIDYNYGGSDDINTFGGGLSASMTLDKDSYVASMAFSYQYNRDDIDVEDDYQHLIKFGVNAGYRFGQNIVVTLFSVWNKDITDYKYSSQDDDYCDLGTEVTMNLSDTFGLTVGYKKVVSLDNYDSDEVYLGSTLKF